MSDETPMEWTVIPFTEPETSWGVKITAESDDLVYIATPRGEEEIGCHASTVVFEIGGLLGGVRVKCGFCVRGWDMSYNVYGEFGAEWKPSIHVEDGRPVCIIECPEDPPVRYRVQRGDDSE